METLVARIPNFKSVRLRQLLSFDDQIFRIDGSQKEFTDEEITENPHHFAPGLFPRDHRQELKKFETLIVWKKMPGTNAEIPEPQPGFDDKFDLANSRVDGLKEELNAYMKHLKETKFGKDRRVTYSHAKFRYEIEVPVEFVEGKKKPQEFEFTSQRKGYERFHTPVIKGIVDKLEEAEE